MPHAQVNRFLNNNNKLLEYFIDIINIDINIQKVNIINWFITNYSHIISNNTSSELEQMRKSINKSNDFLQIKIPLYIFDLYTSMITTNNSPIDINLQRIIAMEWFYDQIKELYPEHMDIVKKHLGYMYGINKFLSIIS
jgi:hypothetical protein